MQVQHMAERTVSELQSYHIQEHHLNSMGEEAHITCPIASCSKMRHSIPHMLALNYHLRNVCGLTKSKCSAQLTKVHSFHLFRVTTGSVD
jgi:hypothetical protein